MDDKGDHILIDITGITDWEWGQTAPKGEAFAASILLLEYRRIMMGRRHWFG